MSGQGADGETLLTAIRDGLRVNGRLSTTNLVGGGIVLALVLIAIVGPELTPHSPIDQNLENRLAAPSSTHPFGTDPHGRDILARVVHGARLSLGLAAIVTGIRLVIGLSVGLVAGYLGGLVDAALMRLVDVQLAFPGIVLALVIAGMLGPSLTNIMIALAVVGWASYARVVRGSVLSLKERPFVEASKLAGTPRHRILLRVLLPNTIAPVVVLATLNSGGVILGIAGLSFIGLGAQPPTAEWGRMVSNGQAYIQSAWWVVTIPGLAIMVTVIGFNLLGDGLRDSLAVEEEQHSSSRGL